jgi:hypothetical protein
MRHSNSKVPILAAVLMTLALNLHADPIQDGALASYRAGWFANTGSCADTCKAKAPGSLAEYEASAVPHTKRAFVCRVEGKPNGDIRTWLYGSQFDDRAACYTTGLDLKGSYAQKYFCLCVVK